MRKGPDTGLKDKAAQEKFLLEKSGIRGLQWGNSVTDDERKHHLEYVASSFKDLTEILGLPPEMGSFNGRLGLAIGARGKSRAMAHYEPGTNVINLTRKNGVGSLAHEWGHFFDKTLSDTHGLKGFLSDHWGSVEQSPVHAAMKDLVKSDEWGEFRDQVKEELRKGGYGLKADYWISTIEMFARAFEVHVDEKLRDAGRLNTYLAGSPKTGMWPTKELAAKLKPKFDKIFEAFKNSEHLKKAMEKLSPYADLRQALIKDI